MKIMLNVSYTDETNKHWMESGIKNHVTEKPEKESIHEYIRRIIETIDYVEFSYNGKPQGLIYVDRAEGSVQDGYHYRVKADVMNNYKWTKGYFTAWVSVYQVTDYSFPHDPNLV